MLPKLVRDKIPGFISNDGKFYRAHVADSNEYDKRLIDKFFEEIAEFQEDHSLEELADVYEVFLAITANWNYKLIDVQLAAEKKREFKGAFNLGVVLDEVRD